MSLMEEFKAAEAQFDFTVPAKGIYAIRVDGRAFHTFTKGMDKPYDTKFINAMNEAAVALCHEVSNSLFAYVQSDEITVFFSDLVREQSQLWFGGRLNKWISASASLASVVIARAFPNKIIPTFDARAIRLDSMNEVEKYLVWRSRDAYKNAITMAASCHRSHKELLSLTTNDRVALLEGTEHAVDLLPRGFRYGRIVSRKKEIGKVDVPATRNREAAIIEVERYKWVVSPATCDVAQIVLARAEARLRGEEESF